jgi:hypothetical protein
MVWSVLPPWLPCCADGRCKMHSPPLCACMHDSSLACRAICTIMIAVYSLLRATAACRLCARFSKASFVVLSITWVHQWRSLLRDVLTHQQHRYGSCAILSCMPDMDAGAACHASRCLARAFKYFCTYSWLSRKLFFFSKFSPDFSEYLFFYLFPRGISPAFFQVAFFVTPFYQCVPQLFSR